MKIINKIIKAILQKFSRVIFHLIPAELYLFFKIKEKDIHAHYRENEILQCFRHFEKHLQNAAHLDAINIRKYAIKKSLLNDKEKNKFYLEFGVWKGTSINFFSDYVKTIYGFDSFEGLPHDWEGQHLTKGAFNLDGKIPKMKSNVIIVKGYIENTLENFLNVHNPKINFVHVDVDTYKSSLYILKSIKSYLDKGAIIIFDELYNYTGWRNGEYKALQEVFNENEYTFRAFSTNKTQVVIQLN